MFSFGAYLRKDPYKCSSLSATLCKLSSHVLNALIFLLRFATRPRRSGYGDVQGARTTDACIELMNGRWFVQRQLYAETWDGKTEEELEERPKKWDECTSTEMTRVSN